MNLIGIHDVLLQEDVWNKKGDMGLGNEERKEKFLESYAYKKKMKWVGGALNNALSM